LKPFPLTHVSVSDMRSSTLLLRQTPWGCRGHKGSLFCMSTLFPRQDIPYQSITGQVASSFQTTSPDITLKCCLLMSFTWAPLLPAFLSRLGNTLSYAVYLFADKLFSLYAQFILATDVSKGCLCSSSVGLLSFF